MPAISAVMSRQALREAFEILPLHVREVIVSVCGENYRAATTRKIKYLRQGLTLLAKHWKLLRG